MSSLEKNLYKQVTVRSNKGNRDNSIGSRAYRGISTVNPENSSTVLYDLALIKQDLLNHFHIRQGEKGMITPGSSYPGSPIEMEADEVAGKYIKIYGEQNHHIFQ